MDFSHFNVLIAWVARHPDWAYAAVALAAFAESLAIVGLFIPGALIMFAAGAIVAAGALDVWPTLGCAAAGAVAGDTLSYGLGHRYRAGLPGLWPFSRHPLMLEKATTYFHRHGGASIFLGRFVGPMRPLIPAVAGMLGMTPARFYTSNVLSALVWAPAYVLPGVVFGASLALAGAVATRLALIIALLLMLSAASLWTVRIALIWLQPRVEQGLARLQVWASDAPTARADSVRDMIAALLDPARPESRSLLLFGTTLFAAAWMFFGVIEDVLSGDPLVAIDKAVYHALQELRTPIGDTLMIALTELGDAAVTLPVVIAVLLWLLWKRAWRPVAYWIAAAGFGAALTVILKAGFGLPRPLPLYDGSVAFGFPSGHAAMSMVVFGFLAVLCARELGLRGKLAVFSVAALIAGLIAFSRLYLGAHWLSDVLGGLSFGLAWIAMLGMAYARRPAPAIAARGLLLVAGLAFVTGAVVHGENQRAADRTRYAPQFTLTLMPEADWWHAAWETLPAWRIDIKGENEQPLTFQWAGVLKPLRAELAAHGWREAPPTSAGTLLYWLDSRRPAMQLPLLPHAHNGHHEALALIRPIDGSPERRLVLRLWPTARALAPDRTPLWVGTVAEEILSRPLHGFNLPRDSADFNTPLHILRADLVGVTTRRVIRNNAPLPEDDDENRDIVWDRSVLLAFQAGVKK